MTRTKTAEKVKDGKVILELDVHYGCREITVQKIAATAKSMAEKTNENFEAITPEAREGYMKKAIHLLGIAAGIITA